MKENLICSFCHESDLEIVEVKHYMNKRDVVITLKCINNHFTPLIIHNQNNFLSIEYEMDYEELNDIISNKEVEQLDQDFKRQIELYDSKEDKVDSFFEAFQKSMEESEVEKLKELGSKKLRKIFNTIIRNHAKDKYGGNYARTYNLLYSEISDKLGIDLYNGSGKTSMIEYLDRLDLLGEAVSITKNYFNIESMSEIKERINEKGNTEEYMDYVYKN